MPELATADFNLETLEIHWTEPGVLPDEVVALRKAVYTDETGLLAEKDLVDSGDKKGRQLCLYAQTGRGRELLAAIQIVDAEASDFGRHTGIAREVLEQGYFGSRAAVAKPYRKRGLLSLMLYLAMREYRMKGRKFMFGFMEPGNTPGFRIMRYRTMDVPARQVFARDGSPYEVIAGWQEFPYGMHRAFETMPDELKAYVANKGLFASEIEATVRARIESFLGNPWIELLKRGQLTREHYVAVLSNMHQFVRWTTRILGKVIGACPHSELRRHYIRHLAGEIDHEVLIESDLEHLGADVDYVKNYMAPLVEIQEFMRTQESLCAFHQDPILFLAVPFSIEGLSGHLPKEVLQALVKSIESWGVENPRKALSFLASHVHTDGGEDGHWEMSRRMLARFVTTEAQAQQFLNVVALVMNSLERAYAAYASIPVLTPVMNPVIREQPRAPVTLRQVA